MTEARFFDRDISWLYFNERVLMEAADDRVPLMERIRFLSIFSSNLDEFYRVRMPVLLVGEEVGDAGYKQAIAAIHGQQQLFGKLLTGDIIPMLRQHGIELVYNSSIPESITHQINNYFFDSVAGLIEIAWLGTKEAFFPENNRLYLVAELIKEEKRKYAVLTIPSHLISRFYTVQTAELKYILFLDDIVRVSLPQLFDDATVTAAYNIKITRDAVLDLHDEYDGDIADKIEAQVNKRDKGAATRFLYPPSMPLQLLQLLVTEFNVTSTGKMQGGTYHHLRDLFSLPVTGNNFEYAFRQPLAFPLPESTRLFNKMLTGDVWVHTPYQSYNTILRFFNEAAIDASVSEIYTTMYRVAIDSKIAQSLITASKNGKTVMVFVELKARFDEVNNLKWAKKMKAAGIKIVYSIPGLKVHAKIALVKKRDGHRQTYLGLLATGNLNEGTARFYTDHILLTAHPAMLRELELVFLFLARRKRPEETSRIRFEHLLVAQFNLKEKFFGLIDNEIANAAKGIPSRVVIKLNNLEERSLIEKLYEASCAGVQVDLIVRSVCCLIPGVPGMSERIGVKRIVDRYLEHGRIFVFHNGNDPLVFLGSSDWMNRNIYRRIEVCFPVYDNTLKNELLDIIDLQLSDDLAAVTLDQSLKNVPISEKKNHIRSQNAIYDYCVARANRLITNNTDQ